MDIRRIRQVCEYGWKDAIALSLEEGVNKGKWSIFLDILSCFFKYNVWSNQYKKENLHLLSGEQKKEICLKYQEKNNFRDKWVKEFFDNHKFLNKWSSYKYERSATLQSHRINAYQKHYGFGDNCFVGYNVIINKHHYSNCNLLVHNNCHFAEGCVIDYTGGLEICDDVSMAEGTKILTHSHDIFMHDGLFDKSRPVKFTPLTINEGAWLGARCLIMPGVTEIGRHAVVYSQTVVVNRVPPYALVAGNPGKVVGFRLLPDQIIEFEKKNYPEGKRLPLSSLNKDYERFVGGGGDHLTTIGKDSEIISVVRSIVSASVGYQLSPDEDGMTMEQIEGWGSLTNMSIIASVEQHYNIRISSDEMFEMTSVEAIANVVKQKLNGFGDKVYSYIAKLYSHSPLWSKICENIEKFPDKLAIVSNGERITYSSLYEHVCKAANLLRTMGLKQGDRIVLSARKDVQFVYIYFASHILGLVNVIIDSESNKSRREYVESKVQPQHCFGYKSSPFPSSLYNDLNIDKEDLLTVIPELQKSDINENDISEILFTTGTTGQPKGVCLSYSNIYYSALYINEYINNNPDDKELLALPLCHSFGIGRLRCNLLKGATIFLVDGFGNMRNVLKCIEEEKVTGFAIVPSAWAYILKVSGKRIGKYGSQINYIEIGSAAMPEATKKELLQMFPNTRICMHYGLTEASRSVFMEFHDSNHLNSIGKPISSDVSIKIFDECGDVVNNGEIGEICIKGKMVMKSYLDPSDDTDSFYGHYLRTGDMGYINEEGYIYLTGRKKEIINVGGKKVSPQEVEEAIVGLGVGDCVCIAAPDPQGILGEVVKCYILKDSTTLTFEEIDKKLTPLLEAYKKPSVYEWIDKIPHTESGKKQRMNLAEAL